MAPWGRGGGQSVVAVAVMATFIARSRAASAPAQPRGRPIYAVGRPAEKTALEANGYATCALRKDSKVLLEHRPPVPDADAVSRVTRAPSRSAAHYRVPERGRRRVHRSQRVWRIGDGARELRSSLTPVLHLSRY